MSMIKVGLKANLIAGGRGRVRNIFEQDAFSLLSM
jgi:hypothetical protein